MEGQITCKKTSGQIKTHSAALLEVLVHQIRSYKYRSIDLVLYFKNQLQGI